jgi:hypothetical protein
MVPEETASPPASKGGAPRDLETIDADLAAVRDELAAAAPKVDADRQKTETQARKIANAERRWKETHDADQPFDRESLDPPLVPYTGDQKLLKEYHKLHYRIARLENERAAAARREVEY